jgi:hypothetical protein
MLVDCRNVGISECWNIQAVQAGILEWWNIGIMAKKPGIKIPHLFCVFPSFHSSSVPSFQELTDSQIRFFYVEALQKGLCISLPYDPPTF